ASGLRNTSTSPRAAVAPRFAPPAKPRFVPVSTRRTHGCLADAAAALPSVEPLSTRTTSCRPFTGARLARQPSSVAPAFQSTMMIDAVTGALLPELRREDVPQRAELALRQQRAQAALGPADVHAVPEAGECRRARDGGLLRIRLPRMEVEHGRLSLGVDAADRAAREPERQDAEPAAADDGEVAAPDAHRARRDLPDALRHAGREAARRGHAVPLAAAERRLARRHGQDARVVAQAVVAHDAERPARVVGQGEGGRAIAEHAVGAARGAAERREGR